MPIRYNKTVKKVDIKSYLPEYLRESETNDLVGFYEDFLNNMFDDDNEGFEVDFNVSLNTGTSAIVTNDHYDKPKLSILEKIYRVLDNRDPNLIDIELIDFFMKNFGQTSIDFSKESLSTILSGTSDPEDLQRDEELYTRVISDNFPNWIKERNTNNSIKMLLYSFGIVADIAVIFSNDYEKTRIPYDEDFDSIEILPNNYFPTPHFYVYVDLNESVSNVSIEKIRRESVVRAVNSIKNVNTVFEGLAGRFDAVLNTQMWVNNHNRLTYYIPWG